MSEQHRLGHDSDHSFRRRVFDRQIRWRGVVGSQRHRVSCGISIFRSTTRSSESGDGNRYEPHRAVPFYAQ